MDGINLFNGKVGCKIFAKAACTSIKLELYRLRFGEAYDGEKTGVTIHQYIKRPEIKNKIDNCDFKFVVIRDPVKRFLSAYSNRVTHHKELSHDYLHKEAKGRVDEIPMFDPTLSEFIKHFPQYYKVRTIRKHTEPMHKSLAGKDLSFFDKVYTVNQLDQLEEHLTKLLSKNVKFGRHETGGYKYKLGDLSYRQLKYLIDFYRDDYKLLEGYYSPETIWKEWWGEAKLIGRIEFKLRENVFRRFFYSWMHG